MQNKTKSKNQKGVTLLELLMVVGIAAVIAVSAIVFFNSTDQSQKVSAAARNLATLSSGISNMFASVGYYDGLSNAAIRPSNVVPDNMKGPGANDIRNVWDSAGVVVTSGQRLSATIDDVYVINYNNVPDKACVDFVTKVYASYFEVQVNGVIITNVPSIAPECTAGNNTLTFVNN